jgi:hypothetical protein
MKSDIIAAVRAPSAASSNRLPAMQAWLKRTHLSCAVWFARGRCLLKCFCLLRCCVMRIPMQPRGAPIDRYVSRLRANTSASFHGAHVKETVARLRFRVLTRPATPPCDAEEAVVKQGQQCTDKACLASGPGRLCMVAVRYSMLHACEDYHYLLLATTYAPIQSG